MLYAVLFFAVWLVGFAQSSGETVSADIVPVVAASCTSSVMLDFQDVPCEQASGPLIACTSELSFSGHVKDFHDDIENPFVRIHKIENRTLSYTFFAETFHSSKSLSQLQRLNI